jgi:hypothetical protein
LGLSTSITVLGGWPISVVTTMRTVDWKCLAHDLSAPLVNTLAVERLEVGEGSLSLGDGVGGEVAEEILGRTPDHRLGFGEP